MGDNTDLTLHISNCEEPLFNEEYPRKMATLLYLDNFRLKSFTMSPTLAAILVELLRFLVVISPSVSSSVLPDYLIADPIKDKMIRFNPGAVVVFKRLIQVAAPAPTSGASPLESQ